MSKYLYLIKALRAYRHTTYGQFDQESRFVAQETQDAANAIEQLEREQGKLRDSLAKLITWAETYARETGIDVEHSAGPLASDIDEARDLVASLSK